MKIILTQEEANAIASEHIDAALHSAINIFLDKEKRVTFDIEVAKSPSTSPVATITSEPVAPVAQPITDTSVLRPTSILTYPGAPWMRRLAQNIRSLNYNSTQRTTAIKLLREQLKGLSLSDAVYILRYFNIWVQMCLDENTLVLPAYTSDSTFTGFKTQKNKMLWYVNTL